MVSVEALISVRRLPHRVSHVNRENRPATPRPCPVQRADRISDPISPPMIGVAAVSPATTFSGFHCQGFGFTTASAEVAKTNPISPAARIATVTRRIRDETYRFTDNLGW